MFELLTDELECFGYQLKNISIDRILEIQNEYTSLFSEGHLSEQRYKFISGFYNFDLEGFGFEVKSLIIIASPSPQVSLEITYQGRKHDIILPPTYAEYYSKPAEIEIKINQILHQKNYHAKRIEALPLKMLAVRSGMGEYGRNNLCYVPDMGSFNLISAFYSDLPITNDDWCKSKIMKQCDSCNLCTNACPTGAIKKDQFLVEVDQCITYFNEFTGSDDFPIWIDPQSHNSLIGCIRCQYACPKNKEYLGNVLKEVSLNEAETKMIMEGLGKELLPNTLLLKLKKLNLDGFYYGFLGRNLRAVLKI